MSGEDIVEVEGTVVEELPNGVFRVELSDGQKVLAHPSGELRKLSMRIISGTRVAVTLSPYDRTRGRIIRRCE